MTCYGGKNKVGVCDRALAQKSLAMEGTLIALGPKVKGQNASNGKGHARKMMIVVPSSCDGQFFTQLARHYRGQAMVEPKLRKCCW